MSNLVSRILPNFQFSALKKVNNITAKIAPKATFIFLSAIFLMEVKPALAHHPMGGKIPNSFIEGFLSGLGHPVIGLDHLVFVITLGLLAALRNKIGLVIPFVFVLATAVGTGIHLLSVDLPLPEVIISASVLIMGVFLAQKSQTNFSLLIGLGAIAGIFHGYAYGEAIIGAETTALTAYLLGFCAIQLAIGAIAFNIGRLALVTSDSKSNLSLRFAGFVVCGIGAAFFSTTVLG